MGEGSPAAPGTNELGVVDGASRTIPRRAASRLTPRGRDRTGTCGSPAMKAAGSITEPVFESLTPGLTLVCCSPY